MKQIVREKIIKLLGGYTEKPKTKTVIKYLIVDHYSVIWTKDGKLFEQQINTADEVLDTLKRVKNDLGVTNEQIRDFARNNLIRQI